MKKLRDLLRVLLIVTFMFPASLVSVLPAKVEADGTPCFVQPIIHANPTGRLLVLLNGLNTENTNGMGYLNWFHLRDGIRDFYDGVVTFSYNQYHQEGKYTSEDTGLGIASHIDALKELLESCKEEETSFTSVDLIGHSQGGFTGFYFLKQYGFSGDLAGYVKNLITLDSPINGSTRLCNANFPTHSECYLAGGYLAEVIRVLNSVFNPFLMRSVSGIDMGRLVYEQPNIIADNKAFVENLKAQQGTEIWNITNTYDRAVLVRDAVVEGHNNIGNWESTISNTFGHSAVFEEQYANEVVSMMRPVLTESSNPNTPPPAYNVGGNSARFIAHEDLTGSLVVLPKQTFKKTWRIKNVGTTTWGSGYKLSFQYGNQLWTNKVAALSGSVAPNQETLVSVTLTAPSVPGEYQSYWKMTTSSGQSFGDLLILKVKVQNDAAAIGVGTGQVKLFTAANYGGTASSFGTGGTNAPDATAFSLQMPDGWSVRTYRADNYTGQGTNTRCWSASVPNLQDHDNWQGAIQSMQVYNYNDCGGGQSVKLYKQTNYVNLDREYLPELSNLPNKDTYSIDIPAGWSVWTYDQDNRGGGKKCWSSSVPNLQDTGWHNQIASIEVFTTNQCADNSNVLELCTNTGLTGCTAVNESTHSLQTSGFGNDNAKSIRVTGDWRAVLFHGENYEGAKQLFTSSDNDLSDTAVGNNQASSIQVRKVDPTRVILYDLGDLNGEPFPSDRTVVNLENWFFNDKAESVRVDPGYEVIICSDANFRGVCGRTNVNKNDLNDVAYGLRNNVSSVRVCEGSCPATSMVPIIAGPVDTASFLPGSDVAFSWVGNGEEYYIEYWGGDLSGTHNSNGIYGTTSWTKSGLPASQNPYYWHVRSWSPYGQTAWSPTYSFKVQDIGPKDVVIAGPDVATVNQNHIYTAFINPNDAANLNLVWSPTPVSGQGTLEATYNWTTVGPRSISLAVSNTGGNATGSLNIEVECPVGQYKVEYFGNKTLSGQPLETKCETGIDKTWNGSGPTVVPSNGFKVGDGSDGALDVPTGQTVYTDAVRTKVMNSAAIGENYICVQSTTGFEIGDEVLIIQSQGTGVGNYEFAKITQVSGCNLTLQSNLVNAYTTPNSKVQVLKVPNYTFVTVSGKLTAHPWDGDTGGVLAFRATNGVSLTGGSIDATALGYRGAPRTYGATMQARQGESTTGEGSLSRMHFVSAGGGGEGTSEGGTAGGGGAYRTPGGHGYDPSYGLPGHGSTILYGSDELTQLFFGSSGGAGGTDDSAWNGVAFGGRGGNGGGIIFIETNTITGTGSILNKGENGEDHDGVADSEQGGGGAGAGGSTKLLADKVDLDDVTVEYLGGLGGKAKEGVGGSGGSGQVYTRYCQNFSANALPGASAQESNCDKDNFSARWTADIDFATAGTYKFNTWTDDGTKLWVDDTLLVDRWVDQGGDTNYFGTKALTAGIHKVVMEYYENGGGAKAKLTIDQPTNSAPEVGQIPGQTITAGASFTTFDLDNYVTDADQGDTITWSYSGNTNLTVAIDTNKVVTITYPQNWTGENNITFRATDSANAFDEASALFKVNASATCPGQFQAEYFNNKTLSGTPVLARCEDEVDNDWGGGGPGNGVNNDNFSARWQKTMQLGAGDYTFGTASDDGVRLWLNNQLVIDNWTDHGLAIDEYEVTLAAGEYTVKMEYYESGGGAIAAFWMDFRGTVCDYLQGEFCAEYFNNPYLEGMPIYDTVDDEILNDWGGGGPGNGVPNDGFSARWKGSFYFAADDYDFTTGSDDGIRVWVDDVLIIDNWDPHGYEEDWVEIDLTEGYHDIKVEYYEYGGGALAGLWWED